MAQITPEVYNTFMNVPCASMCMGTAFWRTKYAGSATEAVCDLGIDGIYMDQACSSLACYDATRGHPVGGGAWWMQGFQTLAADIREHCEHVRPRGIGRRGMRRGMAAALGPDAQPASEHGAVCRAR